MEKIKPVKGRRFKISTLAYLGDLAGCGTIRVVIPTILLNQYLSPNFEFNQFFLSFFTRDLSVYKTLVYTIFQRSATEQHLELIRLFKSKISPITQTKAIYEIDDYLIDIPEWNYAADYYKGKRGYIINILREVDGIIVSTDRLKEVYSQYNPNIRVVPNHLCKFYWGEPEFKVHDNPKPRILWPGSSNHFAVKGSRVTGGDFGSFLLDYIRKTVNTYDWVFVGGLPLELEDLKSEGKIEVYPWQTVYNLPGFMKSLKADVAIAPLANGVFNECKSNIKVLEYCAIGVPGVYKNIHPYYNCYQRSDTEEGMMEKVEALLRSPSLREETWKRDLASIRSQLFWEENDNLIEYINQHLRLFGKELEV